MAYRYHKNEMTDSTKLQISESLASQLLSGMSKTQYDDLSEYVEFILEEVVQEIEMDEGSKNSGINSDQVENRLKSLGYLGN